MTSTEVMTETGVMTVSGVMTPTGVTEVAEVTEKIKVIKDTAKTKKCKNESKNISKNLNFKYHQLLPSNFKSNICTFDPFKNICAFLCIFLPDFSPHLTDVLKLHNLNNSKFRTFTW